MVVNPGGLYSNEQDVTLDINGSRLHGRVFLAVVDNSGSQILKPLRVSDSGALLVDIGSNVNINIGSIVMNNAIEIQDNDTGNRLNINGSGAASVNTLLADNIWTNGGAFTVGSGFGSDIDFPFIAQSVLIRTDKDINFYLKPYENSNQSIFLEALDGEFRIDGVKVEGVNILTVSEDTIIQIISIKANEGSY